MPNTRAFTPCIALLLLAAALASSAAVRVSHPKPSINNTVEHGVSTECKTCPYSLCTNKLYYDSDTPAVVLQCWTHGTEIAGDNIWLGTSDGCYVTQYDLALYNGSYTRDLEYCGSDSEEENLTEDAATTQYDTECNICPWIDCDTVQYLGPQTDLIVTCWTNDSSLIISDSIWVKTTSNCYVAEIGLTNPVDTDLLDPCGPIPYLEVNNTQRVVQRSTLPASKPVPEPEPKPSLGNAAYLINVTVGEDYANCHSCPAKNCSTVERYAFGTEIWLQCIVVDDANFPNETFWSETTDFCYVRSEDLFQSPEGDYYKFPLCSNFQ
ncbi:hypothetical protein AOQ84DRAFT_280768 [Glonium stellatum]|uniref:Uncharacterized protein n=1 Tax=Glonium stellatum TaxID=574774 RepID=A0A8E2FD21_9PEZI|nr:hypothetical protein AOQ84DRAFT_280768 [Glonium stellatum]